MGVAAVTKAIFDGVTYNVRQGSNAKDTLIGGLGNDWVRGGAGDDTIADVLGNNLFDGGSGSDTIIGGIGDDIFIHRMSENAGSKDRYEGALGTDTLRLELTAAEWARADVQMDIAAVLGHMASTKNKLLSRLGLTSEFTFKSIGLAISNIEKLEVRVDGLVMNLADEAVAARPDTLRTYEGASAVSVNLLANDSAPDRIASIELLTQSRFGAVTLTPSPSSATQTAVLAFTPSLAMQALAVGETRTETLTYRITDVDGDVSTSTVTIFIEGRNDVAVIGTPNVSFVQEDVGVSGGELKASGTISISDADQGEALFKTAVVAQADALGTLTLAANGTYTYAVDNDAVQALGADQTRIDSFRIESVDGTQKIVSFTVRGNNDGPTAVADIAGPLVETGSAPGLPTATGNVLTNDTDLDSVDTKIVSAVNGDPAKVGTSVAGTYGNLVLHPNGSWEYALDDNAVGTDRLSEGQTAIELFSYTTKDSQNATSSTTLAITIRGANDAPTVSGRIAAAATEDGASLTIDLLQHASDVDFGAVQQVENFVLLGPGAPTVPDGFTWSSSTLSVDPSHPAFDALAAGQQRMLTFSYDVIDEHGARTAQIVTVTITGTNDLAVIGGVSIGTVTEDAAATLTTSGILTIADGDASEDAFVPQPSVAGTYGTFTLAADGTWTYTADSAQAAIQQLAAGQSLTDSFEALSLDGSARQSVTVTIKGTNDSPAVVSGHVARFTEGTGLAVPVAIDPFLTVTDVDSPILRGASVTISGNYVRGEDSISVSPTSGISWQFNQVTGTLTLTGEAPVAAYEASLRTVSYSNRSEHPTEGDRTFTFSVSDGSSQGAATSIVSVTGVDDVATASTRKIIFADHLATSVVIPKYLLVSDPDEISASVTVQGVTGGTTNWTSDSVTFAPIVPADNVSLATAQMIDRGAFGPMQNSDLGSQTSPSVSVSGSLNTAAEVDWYAVTLLAGETITLDIDRAYGPIFSSYWNGTAYVSYAYNGPDTKLSIHAPGGGLVNQNLYSNWLSGGGGSNYNFHDGWGSQWSYDPYIQYTASVGGKYYFSVASEAVYIDHTWRGDARTGNYTLNVTLSGATGTSTSGSYLSELNPDGFWGQEGSLSYLISSGGTTSAANVAVSSNYRNQSVQGTQAAELLIGTSGADALAGNGGSDYIFGGKGSDSLIGGAGADTFFFQKGDLSGDRIVDFVRGEDQLRFAGYTDAAQLELISVSGNSWTYSVTDGASLEAFTVNVELLRSDYLLI